MPAYDAAGFRCLAPGRPLPSEHGCVIWLVVIGGALTVPQHHGSAFLTILYGVWCLYGGVWRLYGGITTCCSCFQ